jgi:Flp pilus assembly protein TadG
MVSRQTTGSGLRSSRRPRQRRAGQALLEFGLVFPMFLFTLMIGIQLGVIFLQEYSLLRTTRETARWLAINKDADAVVATAVEQHLKDNALTLLPAKVTSVVPYPTCGAATDPDTGQIRCANREASQWVIVTASYDISHVVFLPTTFSMGGATVKIPVNTRTYTASALIE